MRRIVASLFSSLDGVVERPKDWRLPVSAELGQVMSQGLADVDAVLLGRHTYLEFEQTWKAQGNSNPMARFLNETQKYLASNTVPTPLTWGPAEHLTGDLQVEVGRLRQTEGGTIQIPGSPRLAAHLLEAGLLDELQLIVEPVVVGSGARMFDATRSGFQVQLEHSEAIGNSALLTYSPAA